jgi:hypothetical protein
VVAEMIDLRTGYIHADRIIATAKAFARATGLPIVWIIIDLAGGDENSSKDMGALRRSDIRLRALVVHAAVVHAIDDGIAKRSAALDDPSTKYAVRRYRPRMFTP